ncbi:hypothetical protein [Evansella tamaricis]|uniref:NADH dehydrogenase subunit 4L n=1 Tax=Evansella tamaricis TaxID=2069301 RepID=A0ABS6JNX8_9BACI|nr:hypothetical protein [Evansella tamaricis]MBU9714909.1 hypothetical protein [Evansella tamaricis]
MLGGEKKGRVLLIVIVSLLILYLIVGFFLAPSFESLLASIVGIVIWWFMYEGYMWAKVITIVILSLEVVMGIVVMINFQMPLGEIIWTIIVLGSYVIFIYLLITSKSISDFMYSQQNG